VRRVEEVVLLLLLRVLEEDDLEKLRRVWRG
jgi:hypothetical protein